MLQVCFCVQESRTGSARRPVGFRGQAVGWKARGELLLVDCVQSQVHVCAQKDRNCEVSSVASGARLWARGKAFPLEWMPSSKCSHTRQQKRKCVHNVESSHTGSLLSAPSQPLVLKKSTCFPSVLSVSLVPSLLPLAKAHVRVFHTSSPVACPATLCVIPAQACGSPLPQTPACCRGTHLQSATRLPQLRHSRAPEVRSKA